MPEDAFWHGDVCLTDVYIEADKLTFQRKNYELWLQGAYIYQAFGAFAPIMPAFPKKGAKPSKYMEAPIAFTDIEKERKREKEKEKLGEYLMKRLKK